MATIVKVIGREIWIYEAIRSMYSHYNPVLSKNCCLSRVLDSIPA